MIDSMILREQSAMGRDKVAAGSPRVTRNVGLSSPSSLFPQLWTLIKPSLKKKVLIMMSWCISSGKLYLTCVQDTTRSLIEIRRWAHPYSSLMLCCSSHPRPLTMLSRTPSINTRLSHEPDDAILSQILDLISSSLMDKIQIKKTD